MLFFWKDSFPKEQMNVGLRNGPGFISKRLLHVDTNISLNYYLSHIEKDSPLLDVFCKGRVTL